MSTNSIILALLVTGLEPILVVESDFKSDVSTNSTKRASFYLMPQFDFSTLSVLLFSSIVSAFAYYSFISLKLLPEVILFFKFRSKKLSKTSLTDLNMVVLPQLYSYVSVLKINK